MLSHTKHQVKYTMRNLIVMFVTAVCFLFLLKLKWPKNKNFYDGTSPFWKNIFRPKYIDLVQSVRYRYPATSAKHFSFANTALGSVVNATLNTARHSKIILSRRT